MNIFLQLKHWQLFALSWGSGILLNIFAIFAPALMVTLFPLAMLLFVFGTFGWVWAIATGLHPLLPATAALNIRKFKLLFAIPVVYLLLLCMGAGLFFFGKQPDALGAMEGLIFMIVLLHLASMICIFYGIRFAAKTLKSVELGRRAKLADYAGEFFLIWFSIIGYWLIQPRLNKLTKNGDIQAAAPPL